MLTLCSLIFAISLIYTVKRRKKLLFFAYFLVVMRKIGKNLQKTAQEALDQRIGEDK